MPLVAHVSPCGRLLNERGWACDGAEGRWHRPVKWTFNYLPWLNTTQSECTEHSSPLSPPSSHIAPPIAASHVVCLFFGGCGWHRTRREAGQELALLLHCQLHIPIIYLIAVLIFMPHAPVEFPKIRAQIECSTPHAASTFDSWQLHQQPMGGGAGAGAERMWGWESPVVCL